MTGKRKANHLQELTGACVGGLFLLAILMGIATPALAGVGVDKKMGGNTLMTSTPFIDTCEELFSKDQTPLSLDFQDVPIEDVFHVISDVSGMNIVLTPGIQETTSVMLSEVPWGQALDMVLDNSKLGRVCNDNVIRVDTKDSFRTAKENGEVVTEMIRVNYGDIKEVATRIGTLATAKGTVTVNERTNTLVINDTIEMMKDLVGVVKNLDIPTPQVQIASKIVQINRNFLQELGIQWGVTSLTLRNPQFPNRIITTGAIPPNGLNAANIGAQDGLNQSFMVDLGTTNTPFLNLATSLLTRDGDGALDMQLSALERQGKSRIIANPKVSTADNKEAKIRQGERIPYITVSQNEGRKVEFVDANLELKVTPHITGNQKVYLQVTAEQNSADFSNAIGGAPTINTRSAQTEVLVVDGGTAILGGLHTRTKVDSRRSIPYLGDIPIIGLLFKSVLERDAVDELLIFVTPTIIKSLDSPNS